MSIRILIDPYLVCLPDPCFSQERLELFINGLLRWSECLRLDSVKVLFPDACIGGLIGDNQYPFRHKLGKLIDRLEVDVADPETVCRIVMSLLEHTTKLEDVCKVEALFDRKNVEVIPGLCMERLPHTTRSAYSEALVMLTVCESLGPSSEDLLIVASVLPNEKDATELEISITAQIEDLQWVNPTWVLPESFPIEVSEQFPMSLSYNDYLQGLDLLTLWNGAQSEQGARAAIDRQGIVLTKPGTEQPWGGIREYQLGPQFLDSARNWGFGTTPRLARTLIESCARIVLGVPKNELRPFLGENSKQRCRQDGSSAFRTHITKKGAAFRLMFWQTPEGVIEFANVGPKNELAIF